jgi:hypothetical protein
MLVNIFRPDKSHNLIEFYDAPEDYIFGVQGKPLLALSVPLLALSVPLLALSVAPEDYIFGVQGP